MFDLVSGDTGLHSDNLLNASFVVVDNSLVLFWGGNNLLWKVDEGNNLLLAFCYFFLKKKAIYMEFIIKAKNSYVFVLASMNCLCWVNAFLKQFNCVLGLKL